MVGTRREAMRVSLLGKSDEAMLQAVQAFNNPLVQFRTETFIVLAVIAWTYLMHAYHKKQGIDYRYFEKRATRKRYHRNADGSPKFWELAACLECADCPPDDATKANLRFLIGLRNHIEHHKPQGLDSFLSARYQSPCASTRPAGTRGNGVRPPYSSPRDVASALAPRCSAATGGR